MVSEHDWSLDGLGNWSSNTATINGATSEETRLDTTFNEYYEIDSATQSHDDNGNLTWDGAKAHKWDGFNRLREVSDGGGTIVTFVYAAELFALSKRAGYPFLVTGSSFKSTEAFGKTPRFIDRWRADR